MVYGHLPWFILAYLALIFILIKRNKKQGRPGAFWNFVYWTFLYLALYLGIIEAQNKSYFFLIPLLFLLFFLGYFNVKKHVWLMVFFLTFLLASLDFIYSTTFLLLVM
ncbi:hypothetical protein GCM10025857_62010 [Alicyclobacillus contaminans]|nr:hypothetical protein GCM10025857_62010 [Alicyclobacillus contaminans]